MKRTKECGHKVRESHEETSRFWPKTQMKVVEESGDILEGQHD